MEQPKEDCESNRLSTSLETSWTEFEYRVVPGSHVTNDILKECSKLFSEHYGVWGEGTKYGTPGARVRLSPQRLEHQ